MQYIAETREFQIKEKTVVSLSLIHISEPTRH